MLNYTEPAKLSPSQQAVLHAIEKNPIRYLPKGAVLNVEDSVFSCYSHLYVLSCRWEWSRTIDLEANTSDYRRRIWEINQMPGYKIISFHAPWQYSRDLAKLKPKKFTRHGYILIPPSQKEEVLSL